MPVYDKLVRDLIPEIIRNTGKECRVSTIEGEKLIKALEAKLSEELAEYLESDGELEELADIIEVIEALATELGSSLAEIMRLKAAKQSKRGGFEKGFWLEWVED